VAREKRATVLPLSKDRISGLAPRFPISWTLLRSVFIALKLKVKKKLLFYL
jgi:hypothetical protein